jgi:hypothetical protein
LVEVVDGVVVVVDLLEVAGTATKYTTPIATTMITTITTAATTVLISLRCFCM